MAWFLLHAMLLVPLTRAGIISPIVAVLDRVGAPVEKLLKRANIPEWARTDPETLIPTSSTARLLADGARTQGIENLGLLAGRSEEHTSELQSHSDLVCRLLLEKKNQ